MRKTNILLLSAGILLALAGCQKGTETEGTGEFVRFGAAAGSVSTRTSYGSYGEGYQYQMIDWDENDQVLIWSDNAVNRAGREGKSAVYSLLNINASGRESKASLTRSGEDGLAYQDDKTISYKFWGIYPADKYLAPLPTAGSVSFNVPATQVYSSTETTDGNIVEEPEMTNAIMLATSQVVSKGALVDMKFYPAYTAFEFELKNNTTGDIVLHDVTLSSGSGETAGILAGDVTATLETADGAATTLAMKEGGASSNTVKYSFGNGSGVTVKVGKSMKFTVFTTGVSNLTGLAADFTYGNGTVRHAEFRKNKQPITFTACKKYRLLGIMLQEEWYFAQLNLEGEPMWLDKTTAVDNKNYPEATQFEVEGANNGRYYSTADATERDRDVKADRQKWLMKNEGTVIVRFKVMSPEGYNWLVVPEGDTDYYTVQTPVTVTQDGTTTTTLSDTLEGKIKDDGTTTNVILYITPKNPGTAEHSLHLRTYAVSPDGNIQYSLDSETQLYEMRGYHYFLLNKTL